MGTAQLPTRPLFAAVRWTVDEATLALRFRDVRPFRSHRAAYTVARAHDVAEVRQSGYADPTGGWCAARWWAGDEFAPAGWMI